MDGQQENCWIAGGEGGAGGGEQGSGELQLVDCGRPTPALCSSVVPLTLSLVYVEDSKLISAFS